MIIKEIFKLKIASTEELVIYLNREIDIICNRFKDENIEININNDTYNSLGIPQSMEKEYRDLDEMVFIKAVLENKAIRSITNERIEKRKEIDELLSSLNISVSGNNL